MPIAQAQRARGDAAAEPGRVRRGGGGGAAPRPSRPSSPASPCRSPARGCSRGSRSAAAPTGPGRWPSCGAPRRPSPPTAPPATATGRPRSCARWDPPRGRQARAPHRHERRVAEQARADDRPARPRGPLEPPDRRAALDQREDGREPPHEHLPPPGDLLPGAAGHARRALPRRRRVDEPLQRLGGPDDGLLLGGASSSGGVRVQMLRPIRPPRAPSSIPMIAETMIRNGGKLPSETFAWTPLM